MPRKGGVIEENPFRFYEGKLVVKDAEFLTAEELEAIETKSFNTERLNRVKDIFYLVAIHLMLLLM